MRRSLPTDFLLRESNPWRVELIDLAFRGRSSSKALPPLNHSHSFTTSPPQANLLGLPSINASNVLSPIASRVRERDADAIAEYKKRNRSGSGTTQASESRSTTTGTSIMSSSTSSASFAPAATRTPQPDRRLRPSYSAAQLRSTPAPPIPEKVETADTFDSQPSRNRSGTAPVPSRTQSSPMEGNFPAAALSLERKSSAKRSGIVPVRPQVDGGGFTGPSTDYAVFPEPPVSTRPVEQGTPSKPSSRRAPFGLLSKPLPSIDSQKLLREHRRTASELRTGA